MCDCFQINEDYESNAETEKGSSKIADLFRALEDGVKEIEKALTNSIGTNYPASIERHAKTALGLYRRLTENGNEPKLPVRVATNRFEQSGCHPVSLEFWKEYDAITSLYKSLKMDGHYA